MICLLQSFVHNSLISVTNTSTNNWDFQPLKQGYSILLEFEGQEREEEPHSFPSQLFQID